MKSNKSNKMKINKIKENFLCWSESFIIKFILYIIASYSLILALFFNIFKIFDVS
jgi:hypothetical protein